MNEIPSPTPAATARPPRRLRSARRPPPGAAPGTLVAPAQVHETTVRLTAFDARRLDEQAAPTEAELDRLRGEKMTIWVDVQGLSDLERIRRIGQQFGLHSLVVSDIVHTHQRPKTEIYDDHVVVVLRMPRSEPPFESEQLTLILGEGFVLSFQERPGDCFDPVRARLHNDKTRLRGAGPDYLAYALIDSLIDSYFPILEHAGARTEDIESRVVASPAAELVGEIHMLKHELLSLRHAIWPLREVIGALLREDVALIDRGTRVYLRDCADHAFQLLDMLEIYREIASGLVDLHLSSLSNRMNEVMKVLTVIATTFMPMTFIAGVYGMNFDRASPFNMPELGWTYGYPFALALMLGSAALMLYFFYRRGWIRPRRGDGGG